MPPLRRYRKPRDRKGKLRAYAGKRRKRRNLVKFVPEADSDFAFTAGGFAAMLQADPAKYGLTTENAAEIEAAVSEFRSLLAKTLHRFTRNAQMVMLKDVARQKAEDVVRRYANIIRANPDVKDTDKRMLRIKVRPKRLGKPKCPLHPPALRFLGSGDGVEGVHLLRYAESDEGKVILPSATYGMHRKARPDGAARMELYFDMIPVGEPVPMRPDERGWPKYLDSYTRSPMEVEFPMPSVPMLFVYWGRWVGTRGDRSRWSRPCVARVEGWSPGRAPALPEGVASQMERRLETNVVCVRTPIAGLLPSADVLPEDVFCELSRLLDGDGALLQLRERLLGAAGEESMRLLDEK
jgi:hypothetical protein